jgi:hypothetical protein
VRRIDHACRLRGDFSSPTCPSSSIDWWLLYVQQDLSIRKLDAVIDVARQQQWRLLAALEKELVARFTADADDVDVDAVRDTTRAHFAGAVGAAYGAAGQRAHVAVTAETVVARCSRNFDSLFGSSLGRVHVVELDLSELPVVRKFVAHRESFGGGGAAVRGSEPDVTKMSVHILCPVAALITLCMDVTVSGLLRCCHGSIAAVSLSVGLTAAGLCVCVCRCV